MNVNFRGCASYSGESRYDRCDIYIWGLLSGMRKEGALPLMNMTPKVKTRLCLARPWLVDNECPPADI